ncbi:MAG: Ohr family peroxiredoxin [Pyrinomonadaceae bacterium]|nr:Ohr family peroxiredoxin [Phycisphaerales bacterium]
MPATAKVLFTGKTHTTSGPDGASRSGDGFVDVKLPQPHPAAENLFASAWSACYLGAIELTASQKKIKMTGHPWVDTQIDLNQEGGSFFLRATLSVSLPGVDRKVAETLAEAAHGVCPYSKAVHGNIEITTTVI